MDGGHRRHGRRGPRPPGGLRPCHPRRGAGHLGHRRARRCDAGRGCHRAHGRADGPASARLPRARTGRHPGRHRRSWRVGRRTGPARRTKGHGSWPTRRLPTRIWSVGWARTWSCRGCEDGLRDPFRRCGRVDALVDAALVGRPAIAAVRDGAICRSSVATTTRSHATSVYTASSCTRTSATSRHFEPWRLTGGCHHLTNGLTHDATDVALVHRRMEPGGRRANRPYVLNVSTGQA